MGPVTMRLSLLLITIIGVASSPDDNELYVEFHPRKHIKLARHCLTTRTTGIAGVIDIRSYTAQRRTTIPEKEKSTCGMSESWLI